MVVLRTDIEKARDELASQEEGMRFQGLAVILGKNRWPELIARQRKKDLGLDAYAPASQTPEKIGKGLAASITPTLKKISADAKTAKKNFPDLKMLLFVTPKKVGNAQRKQWEVEIQNEHNLELHIIEREEIITQMMMPENASLRASFLHLDIKPELQIAELIDKTRCAANAVTQTWAAKTKGHPLIDLTAVRIGPNGAESADVMSLEQIGKALSESRRIVLEGPAGRGKTTTLIQLAQRRRTDGTAFIVELPAWISSRREILKYIAGWPAFQAKGLTATDLARIQQTEPFLLLLNGWNEISESNSMRANNTLRELERDFPSAGIIVATRTHHLTLPLPGALRLRLLPLRPAQRADYLAARLGAKGSELLSFIDADPSLDELTRTPFILSEVASLFDAGAEIPSTKIGILAEVIRLQEKRDEHRNALQSAPLFGCQTDYLKALATEMTCHSAVTLHEAKSQAVVAEVSRELADRGQIEQVSVPAVLAMLTAHHVIERLDYPQKAFQFEHQQIQEYYATIDVRSQLIDLQDDDLDETFRFKADYVNEPAWAEPLRMIAETFAEQTGDGERGKRNLRSGRKLVEMALALDLVFAGELAKLCGKAIWNEVGVSVGDRFRTVYAMRDNNFRQYALAAMVATGSEDFSDVIVPLLSRQDQQTRLRTYRLWPDFHVSSLGPNWREQVRGWSEEARAAFVSELLHHRADDEIAAFAAEDDSIAIKKAAVFGLMWTNSDEALTHVFESMDALTFEDVARKNADRMPVALRPKTIAAMRKFIENTSDYPARLRTALDLIDLGENGLDDVIRDTLVALSGAGMHKLDSHYIKPGLEYLRKTDPVWTRKWVAIQIAEGVLYEYEYWLPFAIPIPEDLIEKYLLRLETEDFKDKCIEGMIAVIVASANVKLAERLFTKMRGLQCKLDAEPSQRHKFEAQVMRQLEAVFRSLPDDVAAASVLLSAKNGNALDIKITAHLFSRIARPDLEPLRITDEDLKARLRTYLKNSVDLVLRQDDFTGEQKANLASSIAQVGKPEDMADLLTLIRADIDRMRRGQAFRLSGDRGPIGNGGIMNYAGQHIAAIMHLDAAGAEQVLIDLLPEPKYLSEIAAEMARDFVPKPARSFGHTFRYDLMWTAREDSVLPTDDNHRRIRFTTALNAEIRRLRERLKDGKPAAGLKELVKALAAIDAQCSAAVVLDVIAMPGRWNHYILLDATERLLMAGVVLPAASVFALVDSILNQVEKSMSNSERHLVPRILAICPFVDDPAMGIIKIREVLGKRRLRGYELRELIIALGESGSDAAIDLLYELVSDAKTFGQCENNFINAIAKLDTPRARELLLGFIDPNIHGIVLTRSPHREDVIVTRIAEQARRWPEMTARLRKLCGRDLPEHNRHVLSKVLDRIGTPEALTANLNLIDDAKPSPIPQGIWEQLESAFLKRRSCGQISNTFTEHSHTSDELRVRLFRMVIEDEKRWKSALKLLGQIEKWRLEFGRLTGEPRHPNLASGQSWPPKVP